MDSAELDKSLVSASKNYSSDSEESKGTADENAVASRQVHLEGVDKADAKPSSSVISVDSSDAASTVVNTNGASVKESQEQCGQFCGMQTAEKVNAMGSAIIFMRG